jgi:hypothetical protein
MGCITAATHGAWRLTRTPLFVGRCMSTLGPRISTLVGWRKLSTPLKLYIYIHMLLQSSPEVKQEKERKRGGGSQPNGPVPESSASSRSSTTRATARRASQAICGSQGMSSIGSRPKSMRTLATHASCLHRCLPR